MTRRQGASKPEKRVLRRYATTVEGVCQAGETGVKWVGDVSKFSECFSFLFAYFAVKKDLTARGAKKIV